MTHLLALHLMIITLAGLLGPAMVRAEENELQHFRQEIDTIKVDMETIKRQLSEIQRFLAERVVQADVS